MHQPIVFGEDAHPGPLQIIELTIVKRPNENRSNDQNQHQAQANQQPEDTHRASAGSAAGAAYNRKLFATTTSELKDMPMAASHGGTKPAAAAGTARTL